MAIFNIADYRIDTSTASHTTQTHLPVRRPSKFLNVRVHGDPAYEFITGLLEHKTSGSKAYYLVAPEMMEVLSGELRTTKLVLATGRDPMSAFLWPLMFSLPGNENSWNESAKAAAEKAHGAWGKIVGNKINEQYRFCRHGFITDEPVWPNLSMEELVQNAFEDRVIDSNEHHVVKALHRRAKRDEAKRKTAYS